MISAFSNTLKEYFPSTYTWPEYLHITVDLPVLPKNAFVDTQYKPNHRKKQIKEIIRDAGKLTRDKKKLLYPSLYKICDYYYMNLKDKYIKFGTFGTNNRQNLIFINVTNIKSHFIQFPHITISKDKYGSKSNIPNIPNIFNNINLQLAGVRIAQKGINDDFHIVCTSNKLPSLSTFSFNK